MDVGSCVRCPFFICYRGKNINQLVMKRVIKSMAAFMLAIALPSMAQSDKMDLRLEFFNTLNSDFSGDQYEGTSFKTNILRFAVFGDITDQVSYSYRQALQKPTSINSLENLANQVEFANVTYHPSDRLNFTFGKQFVAFGGWEHNVNVLRIKEFSEFVGAIACYQTGVSATWQMNDNHEWIFQLLDARGKKDADWFESALPAGLEATKAPLMGTINWNSYFADKALHFRYAASALSMAKDKYAYYLTAANIYEKGSLLACLDFMYAREAVDNLGRLSALRGLTMQNVQYFTTIANVEYAFHPQWNLALKAAYEITDLYKDVDIYQAGRYLDEWNVQAGLEYMPVVENPNFKLFAWYLYKEAKASDLGKYFLLGDKNHQRISLGMTYTFNAL